MIESKSETEVLLENLQTQIQQNSKTYTEGIFKQMYKGATAGAKDFNSGIGAGVKAFSDRRKADKAEAEANKQSKKDKRAEKKIYKINEKEDLKAKAILEKYYDTLQEVFVAVLGRMSKVYKNNPAKKEALQMMATDVGFLTKTFDNLHEYIAEQIELTFTAVEQGEGARPMSDVIDEEEPTVREKETPKPEPEPTVDPKDNADNTGDDPVPDVSDEDPPERKNTRRGAPNQGNTQSSRVDNTTKRQTKPNDQRVLGGFDGL